MTRDEAERVLAAINASEDVVADKSKFQIFQVASSNAKNLTDGSYTGVAVNGSEEEQFGIHYQSRTKLNFNCDAMCDASLETVRVLSREILPEEFSTGPLGTLLDRNEQIKTGMVR